MEMRIWLDILSVLNAPDFIIAITNVAFALFLFVQMTSSGCSVLLQLKGALKYFIEQEAH